MQQAGSRIDDLTVLTFVFEFSRVLFQDDTTDTRGRIQLRPRRQRLFSVGAHLYTVEHTENKSKIQNTVSRSEVSRRYGEGPDRERPAFVPNERRETQGKPTRDRIQTQKSPKGNEVKRARYLDCHDRHSVQSHSDTTSEFDCSQLNCLNE